jgi:pantoate--beta-alanine ligase
MAILATPQKMHAWRDRQPGAVGLVPTMGYLHEGHLELVRRSRAENDLTVVSIFVNPTQFGANEDLSRYPRDEERDLRLLRDLGVAGVYLPSAEVIYPAGFETYVEPGPTAAPLEGTARPGHFRGVLTVVLKLFTAVRPDRAYFGRKDAQQLRVIQRMTRDFDLGIEIVPCPTVREADGLAMSSRNVYLDKRDRQAARVLSTGLRQAKAAFDDGVRDAGELRAIARRPMEAEPRCQLEYLSLADDVTLVEIEGSIAGPALMSVAARFGSTRLIDNIELG